MIRSQKTQRLVTASIFAALIFLFTAYFFHIPFATGYIHFGDALIFWPGRCSPRPMPSGRRWWGPGCPTC